MTGACLRDCPLVALSCSACPFLRRSIGSTVRTGNTTPNSTAPLSATGNRKRIQHGYCERYDKA
jgi:hypothetical protein